MKGIKYFVTVFVAVIAGLQVSMPAYACGSSTPSDNVSYAQYLVYRYHAIERKEKMAEYDDPDVACEVGRRLASSALKALRSTSNSTSLAQAAELFVSKIIPAYRVKLNVYGGWNDRRRDVHTEVYVMIHLCGSAQEEGCDRQSNPFAFQKHIVAPYLCYVAGKCNMVKTSMRYYPSGKVAKGCGAMDCQDPPKVAGAQNDTAACLST